MSAETKLLESALQSQIADMKDTILDGDRNAEERNKIFMNRLQEKVKAQVDDSLEELKNKFNENLEVIEQKFIDNNV